MELNNTDINGASADETTRLKSFNPRGSPLEGANHLIMWAQGQKTFAASNFQSYVPEFRLPLEMHVAVEDARGNLLAAAERGPQVSPVVLE